MGEIKNGDYVRIIDQETIAEVISIKGNDLEIGMGGIKVRIKKNRVELCRKPEEKYFEQFPSNYKVDTKEKLQNFKFDLDVRGKAKEEVMAELSSWVDDALLLGIEQAKVTHGKGTGILKETVRSILKKYKEVIIVNDPGDKETDYATTVKFSV